MEVLFNRYEGDGFRFAFIYTREAHPGRSFPHHTSFEDKIERARLFCERYDISRPIWVDCLDGRVHLKFGGMNAMTYIINANGIIVFRQWYTDGDMLSQVIAELHERGPEYDTMYGARPGHKRAYYERMYEMPVDMLAYVKALQSHGIEALADVAVPQVRAKLRRTSQARVDGK